MMLKTLTFGGSLILCVSIGLTQQTMRAEPIPGPVKDAGVFHFATRTWTRGGNHQNLGAKILFANTANSGFFGTMGVPCDLVWTDEGRIPSTGGHPNAISNRYLVQSITLAYCSSVLGGPQTGGYDFYECYTSCTDPLVLPKIASFLFAVPGGVSSTACWLVTFDLKGTSLEFPISGDCDQVFDGTTAIDNFGWTLTMNDLGTGGFNGPVIAGDPNNYPYGDGTYYQNSAATYGTGLGTLDHFWLTDAQGCQANGCYWFGGYQPGSNPFASMFVVPGGTTWEPGDKYCTANANSTGAPADIAASGSASSAAGDLTLTSSPVPNQPGIFFHGMNQSQNPFGNGFMCTTGGITRGAVIMAVGNVATYTYDNSDAKHSLAAFIGSTRHLQHWFRDPMGGGAFFNTSNAISIDILP